MAFKSMSSATPTASVSSIPSSVTSPMDIFASLGKEPAQPTPNASKPLPKEEELNAEEAPLSTTEDIATPETEAADSSEETTSDVVSDGNAEGMIEVKGRGKQFSFKLDKNDKKLQETLSWGVIGPSLAAEKKALKRELEVEKAKNTAQPNHSKYAEATEMAQAGFTSTAVKEILGEELYKKFYNEEIIARIDYEGASPEERLKLVEARGERREAELNWKLERAKGGQAKETQQSKEAQAKNKEAEFEGYAKSAIGKHDFAALDSDSVAQETYKVKVYRMAMDDLESWVEDHKAAGRDVSLTQAKIEKAIARNYKLFLTGAGGHGKNVGMSKTSSSSASGKQAAAKAASKNYDKGTTEELNGLSPAAIFNKLRGKG